METLTYARPDSTIRFHRLALGALILTLVPLTQLLWRWIAFPLLNRFTSGSWLRIGYYLPYMFSAALLLSGVWILSTSLQNRAGKRAAQLAIRSLAVVFVIDYVLANGTMALNLTSAFSLSNEIMVRIAWCFSALGSLLLAGLLISAIFFMLRVTSLAEAPGMGLLSAFVLTLSTLVTLSFFILYLFFIAYDVSSASSFAAFRTTDAITLIASLIHQLAELLLWSTITIWAFRRTSA